MVDFDKLDFLFVIAAIVLMAIYPSFPATLAFVASLCLLAFQKYLSGKKVNDLEKLESQIKQLSERLDQLSLSKGMRR